MMNEVRRRNGKPASCERCRKDKVRCDHAFPVCTRCDQRGLASRCFYHPAPLTRSTTEEQGRQGASQKVPRSARRLVPSMTTQSFPFVSYDPRHDSSAVSSPDALASSTEVRQSFFPSPVIDPPSTLGYLGPTSFVAAFHHDSESTGVDSEPSPHALEPYWMQKASEFLSELSHFTTLEKLVTEYYDLSSAAVIPTPFILNTLASVRETIKKEKLDQANHDQLSAFTLKVIANTSKPLKVTPETEATDFQSLFTANSLRLEIIGVLYSIAGRASVFRVGNDKLTGITGWKKRASFVHRLLGMVDTCLQICRMLTPVNDILVWLLHEDLLLSSLVLGESSSATWSRLGKLSTEIFALGLHREPKDASNVPIFLSETRKRVFAAAFQLDKTIATFLGRPPRISCRHADCRLPLDISDEVLVAPKPLFELAVNSLDHNGWSVDGSSYRASWMRLRYLVSTFREEILELSLRELDFETAEQLSDVSRRCHETWATIPPHLQYKPDCWESDLPLSESIMLLISYLAYLYNEFLIQKLLIQHSPGGSVPLLDVSATILCTLLTLGKQREQVADIQRDYTWTALLYGLSSASVLIRALQNQVRTGEPFLYQGSRAELIRNLSIFISHLESMVQPGSANYNLCKRATEMFSLVINEVLEPQSRLVDTNTNTAAELEMDNLLAFAGFDHLNPAEDTNLFDTDFGMASDQWIV